jgi:hypothetical protein
MFRQSLITTLESTVRQIERQQQEYPNSHALEELKQRLVEPIACLRQEEQENPSTKESGS